MKKYFRLTLFLLRSGGARRNKDKKRGRVGMVFTGLFILLAFLMVMGVNGFAGWQAARMGQPFGSFYPASYGSYSIFVLILAVPTLIALYFTSLDAELLLSLPLNARQVVGAKTTVSMVSSYILVGIFLLPLLVGYGVSAKAGPMFWILGLVTALLLPILPVCMAGIALIVLLYIVRPLRSRRILNSFTMIFSILLFVVILIRSYLPDESDVGAYGASSGVTSLFPTASLAGKAVDGSLPHLLLLVAISAAAVALLVVAAHFMYVDDAVGVIGSGEKDVMLTKEQRGSFIRENAPRKAYLAMQWMRLRRNPQLIFNGVISSVVLPIFIILPIVINLVQGLGEQGIAVRDILDVGRIVVQEPEVQFLITVGCFGIIGLAVAFVRISCYMISIEGSQYGQLKTIPLDYESQIKAKLTPGKMISSGIGLVFLLILGIVLMVFQFEPKMFVLVVVFFIGAPCLSNSIQLLWDLKFARLELADDSQVLAHNRSAGLAVLLGMAAVVFFVILPLILSVRFDVKPMTSVYIASFGCCVCGVIMDIVAVKLGARMLAKLGD